ncbi:two-component hybrid sensor and regulator [Gloeobacter violaceus PCC 7421]|uniref:Circadian input-output histidine kinase CikA n=1 Tax=Gloeobacter violaceus (strain ATCC 29082 / PCC 7421) TaxID=251221 RepID=Q7NMY0_GLOVI|nr:hybrid sensor histidine kinase/response regulator [Gloeobacter violaceus]BAC88576.1 two-component hybrid sensor and regulator [Gloeobacter violaceus PCC 7421]
MTAVSRKKAKADAAFLDLDQLLETLAAVRSGNFSVRLPTAGTGIGSEIAATLNGIIALNEHLSVELSRVGNAVGKEGKVNQRVALGDAAGAWTFCVESINTLITDLAQPTTETTRVIRAVANGDLSQRIPTELDGRPLQGEFLQTAQIVNVMVEQLGSFASEVTRVAREVGTEGKLGVQAEVRGVAGTWKDLTDNVNSMAGSLTAQVRNIAEVTTAVASGDLSKKITVEVKGEILDLKNTINTMVDQLNSFASEVTRVAREVGSEGKLGGQAQVTGVAGTWKDLTDNVNSMAGNLTSQVRGIARIVTAVAGGDLKRKLVLEAKGEIETLAETINEMIDTLATFADQVTTVAREVGIEGKLGGQARVPGASGTWRDLTDNVNELAANLTTQVRAIAEVATAVTKGDLTRSIAVEAQGEVAILKDNINQMIANLRETTQKNTEQDWLKTNLAKFTRVLQGQRDLEAVSRLILSELAPLVSAQHGVFYLMDSAENRPCLKLLSTYAYRERKRLANWFFLGEGLVGQCALEKERILLTDVPGDYIKISSGLGEAAPFNIVVLPVLFEGQVTAVIELASFRSFSEIHLTFLDQLTESIAIVLNTIAASMRTEQLLKQSQSLAEELQSQQTELTDTNKRLEQQANSLQASEERLKSQQEELQQTNEQLQEKARLLSIQNKEVERKNREIEQARQSVEEKARQLALTSKYKSEFLANMSHELRTPLNSLLILARLLSDNAEGNLSEKQVEYGRTIHSAGADLLGLINDILDLAKIESGTMSVEIEQMHFGDLRSQMERIFRQVANDRGLEFAVECAANLPRAMLTDPKRLQQVLKNLLSNAFKFTALGSVTLRVEMATGGWDPASESLNRASGVVAFSVIDTGIGIAPDKQRVIFEAFQQADGSTSRKYGGTGLGLSISREIARLLGGEIQLESEPGRGSTFTLFLPLDAPLPGYSAGDWALFSLPEPVGATRERTPAAAMEGGWRSRAELNDDRDNLEPEDRVLLIIEDDANFARILGDLARTHGFKAVVALGSETGLAAVRDLQPHAVLLDIHLPGMDGWTVLDRLKHDPETRHIPVHLLSVDDAGQRGLQSGAVACLKKPVDSEQMAAIFARMHAFADRKVKNLLVIEDDEAQRTSIVELIGGGDVRSQAVATAQEALALLQSEPFDCVVLDLGLPDADGQALLGQIKGSADPWNLPVIVYTGRDLTPQQERDLKRRVEAVIVKGERSAERLLDETARFMHRVQAELPAPQRQIIEQLRHSGSILAARKVLIVDDDVRNIFALTSALEREGMQVLYAENGSDGIALLERTPGIDMVLMDVMMPGMDGYEATAAIRRQVRFKELPIVALTAKAMRGDREKCLEAGASDYITKPVDTEQLLSLLRVWLSRREN